MEYGSPRQRPGRSGRWQQRFATRFAAKLITGATSLIVAAGAAYLLTQTELLAQTNSQPPANQPPKPTTAPATAPAEPRYGRAVPVSEEMMRDRPQQTVALPREPGEVGDDPQQRSTGAFGKVPTDAHRLPEGYVLADVQASIEQQADWLVGYVPDRQLAMFSPIPQETAAWLAELDQRRLSLGLIKACADKNIAIAPEAKVVVEEPGRRWRLINSRRDLFIQKDAEAVIVRAALPLRILPNKTLMILEAVLSNANPSASSVPIYGISGRVTEFRGNNYILLEHLTQAAEVPSSHHETPNSQKLHVPHVPNVAATGSNSATASVSVTSATSAPAASASTSPATPADSRELRPEEIIKQLMESQPRRAVVLPKTAIEPEPTTSNKPGGPIAEGRSEQLLLWPEETIIVDRPGRIVRNDKEVWWTFAFEDKGLGRKPIRLLPNRMLENAIMLGHEKSSNVVLVVSGEITEHRGTNYLLLRKVLVQRNMGNIR